ncbi:MAG: hypothetical protein JSW58_04965 [Candidatus Latescibacterota bacterium]|nr:MAG: hypothetical protein JSW58_04965 [Candidatus Latescibacterota bacterium]
MIKPTLLRAIVDGYSLPIMGTHGLPHWGRVLETGLRLAKHTGANPGIVTLFAIFHDARRENEQEDPGHGLRGARLAMELRSDHLSLRDDDFDMLIAACSHHTDGTTDADVTIQTCWDADRLDLWRIGIVPDPRLLCTSAARNETIREWAGTRSRAGYVPAFVKDEWVSYLK